MAEVEKHPVGPTVYSPTAPEKSAGPSSLSSGDDIENPTGIKEKAFLRKLDRKLLPALTLLYLLSFLDRSNGSKLCYMLLYLRKRLTMLQWGMLAYQAWSRTCT